MSIKIILELLNFDFGLLSVSEINNLAGIQFTKEYDRPAEIDLRIAKTEGYDFRRFILGEDGWKVRT